MKDYTGWVIPFKVYRVTRRWTPGQHQAGDHEELASEFNDISAVQKFIEQSLLDDPSRQARWRIRDAEGGCVSQQDYEMMPEGQFELRGCKGERVTVRFRGWDIFNYWWDVVIPEVDSDHFGGKGRDYYLSIIGLFNIGHQMLLMLEGVQDSYDAEVAVGALRFSLIRKDSEKFEVAGVLRSWPNHGKQRVEFAFDTTTTLLETTVSQIQDVLACSYDMTNLLALDRYWEKKMNRQGK